MNEWLKIFLSSGISVIFMSLIAWAIKAWVSRVTDKLDKIFEMVHEMQLKGATQDGSVNTRFAILETKVSEHAERMAKSESSTKRLWSKVDPQENRGG